jgi:hypothetical protein
VSQHEQTDLFDEPATLKVLQRDAQTLERQLDGLAKLKPGDADALEKLQKALSSMPTGEKFARAIDELRSRAEVVLSTAKTARAEAFRRHEADFIRDQRAAGTPVRELNTSWRVGPLELSFQRELSRARVLYNKEHVTAWTPIGSREDLEKLVSSAHKRLKSAALPADDLPDLMWETFEHARRTAERAGSGPERVPLVDFFRELRVVLARRELRGKPDRKLIRTEFPLWAFLYNVDQYRRMLPGVSSDRRLNFETGSQQDHKKGIAMPLNGLDANSEYKPYCYVRAAPSSEP